RPGGRAPGTRGGHQGRPTGKGRQGDRYYSFGLTTTPEVFIEKGVANENYLLPRIYVKNSTTLKDFAKLLE
ncbi:hypothetical protein ACFVIJ_20210, partial [Heyndrickxia sporothermodurans]